MAEKKAKKPDLNEYHSVGDAHFWTPREPGEWIHGTIEGHFADKYGERTTLKVISGECTLLGFLEDKAVVENGTIVTLPGHTVMERVNRLPDGTPVYVEYKGETESRDGATYKDYDVLVKKKLGVS